MFTMVQKILRFKDLKAIGVPYTLQHLGRMERAGVFPRRRKINPLGGKFGACGWLATEVDAWLAEFEARGSAAE